MLSRALSTATVMLLIGWFTASPGRAENLEAGKSPSQIFAGTCSACHKGMRGLLKTVAPGSLPGFLRQHYTTSSDMAGLLSAYLLSNGATDPHGGASTKQGKDARSEPRLVAEPEPSETRLGRRQRAAAPQEASRPDAGPDGAGVTARSESKGEPVEHLGRDGRKRLARPGAEPPTDGWPASERQPAATASESGPGGRPLSAKQKLSRLHRPARDEMPRTEPFRNPPAGGDATKIEPSREAPPTEEGSQIGAAKSTDEGKSDGVKPEAARPDSAKADAGRDEVRSDPVPPVAPTPKPSEGETRPAEMATPTPSLPPSTGPGSGNGGAEPSAGPASAGRAPAAVEASTPPPASPAPAGPPAPPISQ
jgi:hypothetical protein